MRAATCKSRVDLPTPGSPPIKTVEPGTAPPPRTVSNSPIPEAMAAAIIESLTDREAARERAAAGLQNRDIYFPEQVAARWETLFDELVSKIPSPLVGEG